MSFTYEFQFGEEEKHSQTATMIIPKKNMGHILSEGGHLWVRDLSNAYGVSVIAYIRREDSQLVIEIGYDCDMWPTGETIESIKQKIKFKCRITKPRGTLGIITIPITNITNREYPESVEACLPGDRTSRLIGKGGSYLEQLCGEHPHAEIKIEGEYGYEQIVRVSTNTIKEKNIILAKISEICRVHFNTDSQKVQYNTLELPEHKVGRFLGKHGTTLDSLRSKFPRATITLDGEKGAPYLITVASVDLKYIATIIRRIQIDNRL